MASIFITGVAGFIGSHVAEALLRRGDRVVGLDNFDPFYDRAIKERNLAALRAQEGFSFTEGDIRDSSALAAWGADSPCDAIIHLAARAGVRPSVVDPAGYADVNVTGTQRVIDLAVARKVPRLLFASSSSVYGGNEKVPFSESDPVDHPVSPYAATKKAGELLCHAASHLHGIDVACLRFFTVYGPRQRPEMATHNFTRLISEGRPIDIYGDGSARRDFTYIDDIVDGILKALDSPKGFRIYNLGESRTVVMNDLVSMIEAAVGKKAERRYHPPQPGDVQVTFADISLAKNEIGYAPKTAIEEGVVRFVDWFLREQGSR